MFTLIAADGQPYLSETKGTFGGNSKDKIYGQMNCWSANRALDQYAKIRVFFADEATAIAAGYRPCGNCMRARYREWKAGQPATT